MTILSPKGEKLLENKANKEEGRAKRWEDPMESSEGLDLAIPEAAYLQTDYSLLSQYRLFPCLS